MSLFVDTGVFYAVHDEDATRHETATTAMSAVLSGSYGRLYTSEYVYDETVTLTGSRTGSFEQARTVGERIRGRGPYPDAFELLFVSESLFHEVIETYEGYPDQQFSFTDASTVALVEAYDIDHVLSFDDDFEGVVPRLDPADVTEQ